MSEDDRRIIGRDIQKVEFGWPLGHGLWEVRSNLTGGRIARVIFCLVRGEMILLHGFEKTTQKTPPKDIALALRRMKEIEE